ncbi:MAG: hypothetical protein EOO92_08540 [Pedobacter sp.]|nr:MAG: hypothetical protein EOO92_08540 [Pedobacter sp.]
MEAEEQETVALVITEDIRSYLYETSKWARFLSIVGFIATVFMVMLSFSISAMMGAMDKMTAGNNPYAQIPSGVLTFWLLIISLIYFYPSFLLFKYSGACKNAVLYGDQESLVTAMAKMKSFFKFWGILLIVMLSFYAIAFIMVVVSMITTGAM